MRPCLNCGMTLPQGVSQCPKCDSDLDAQTNGEIVQIDIAHQGETVPLAMQKFRAALEDATMRRAMGLRVIVGGGLIREEVLSYLRFLEADGRILAFRPAPGNRGAILVTVKEAIATRSSPRKLV